MLTGFLKIVRRGNLCSQVEIAQQLGISPEMIMQIANELIDLGYMEESYIDCNLNQNNCSNCTAKKNCQIILKNWSLTEKGKKAILSNAVNL
jgi:DNA-binding IscR family transcriptional regulator